MPHGLQADIVALHAAPARAALHAIQARPGLSSPELLAAADVGQSTLHHHLSRLVDHGLVERRRDGRRMTWWPTERAAGALEHATP